MMTPNGEAQNFGGSWTDDKLNTVQKYLDAYTTALKNQNFSLVYIDAFAGSGFINTSAKDPDAKALIAGSAKRAIDIDNKPFDKLIFVDRKPGNIGDLQTIKNQNPDRDIQIEHAEANGFLRKELSDASKWRQWRGVLFLDPFATEVEWPTIEAIAEAKFLDTWILFPVSAITRMLPLGRMPDNQDALRLTRIYGGEEWCELYRPNPQSSMFDDANVRRDSSRRLREIYQEKMKNLFGPRCLGKTKLLRNSKKSPLFELFFCVGSTSPKAISTAQRIANYILDSAP